jgi:cytochrome oxidase Cu insertion factor (SCO1/SenC/PrrC family)
MVFPDVTLINQDGVRVRFHSDLVQNKIVAINFIFTTCKGICPPMSANFAQLQKQLANRLGEDVALISVSVDPSVDTSERLKAWQQSFGGGPGWTLLTGDKPNVDRLLKEMRVFTADKNDHSPFILLGDDAAGKWIRVHGLTSPQKLAQMISDLHSAAQITPLRPSAPGSTVATVEGSSSRSDPMKSSDAALPPKQLSAAQRYFTDVELINQHGRKLRLHSDLLKGKVVVINSFFSTCKGSCPVMLSSFARIQKQFADRLGKDLYLISITVDPTTDTSDKLMAYAEQWNAKDGWHFLTGEKSNVETALQKLGQYVENKESHSNIFIIGNEATGLWKKARGLSQAEEIFPLIEEVLNDKSP